MVKIKVEETINLKGEHTGRIVDIQYRTEPYAYTDVFITTDKKEDWKFKVGFPTNLNPKGGLYQLVSKVQKVKAGEEVDVEEILLNKKVSYMVIQQEKEGRTYNNVVKESIEFVE